jgi:ABC-2 type transport system permease protein
MSWEVRTMQSRTFPFNKMLFLKTLRRSWPVWAVYFAVWFLMVPAAVNAALRYGAVYIEDVIYSTVQYCGTAVGAVAAIAAVMAAWSFMYTARSAGAVACLPVSRGGVFLSVSLAGLVPFVAVNVLIALLTAGTGAIYGVSLFACAAKWLGAVTLELLYYYGFALLCAQLTGNLVVLPIVTAVLNFTVYVVELLVRAVLGVFVYGIPSGACTLVPLSPPVLLLMNVGSAGVSVYDEAAATYVMTGYELRGWGWMAIYAAVGIVCALGALALYRHRRMESAGDVVAVRPLKPVFKYCMTFGCALVLGWIIYFYTGEADGSGSMPVLLVLMLLGAFIGYFVSEMLIRKSFRAFSGAWRGFCVSAAVLVALMCAARFDVFGYERRVPDPASVESVYLFAGGERVTYYEPENIELAVELHQSIVDGRDDDRRLRASSRNDADSRATGITLRYELKNGRSLEREYTVNWREGDDTTTALPLAAQELLNTPEGVKARKKTDIELTESSIFSAYVDVSADKEEFGKLQASGRLGGAGYDSYADIGDWPVRCSAELTTEEAYELYTTCILPDIADGTLGRTWIVADESYYRTVSDVTIYIDARIPGSTGLPDDYIYDYFYTTPTKDSYRTNRWLSDHGIPVHMLSENE